MEKWELFQQKKNLEEKRIVLPNATVGKDYQVWIDLGEEASDELILSDITGLENTGLTYYKESNTLAGTPLGNADLKLIFNFLIAGETIEKKVPFAINPDPRSLWKNIESDPQDPWWKADEQITQQTFGTKNLVAASKRGRAHANTGKFREDHYEVATLEKQDWHILVVSDGAGSAALSRLGSKLACETTISQLKALPETAWQALEMQLQEQIRKGAEEDQLATDLQQLAADFLSPTVHQVHQHLASRAASMNVSLSDLHSTLALCLIKATGQGWMILSFSVGDCPIALIYNDKSDVLNVLDSGEYGGATRFISMPEIFEHPDFYTRFSARVVPDFAYLMMMSDGIYDAKFETTFNLAQPKMWKGLIDDLEGNNPEGQQVNLQQGNQNVATQLSAWMDFWSTGNHDDRTLVIIY